MAVGFNASGDIASRSANVPSQNAITICGWAKITSVRSSAYQYFAGWDNADNSYTVIGYDNSGNFRIDNDVDGVAFSSNPTVGEWFFFAMTMANAGTDTHKGYWAHSGTLNTVSADGQTGDGWTPVINLGNDGWDEYCNVHMAYVRIWGSVLSQAELETEMASETPVKSGCVMDWPLDDNTDNDDRTANDYDLTFGGTLTSETSPSFGTSITLDPAAMTATPIAFSVSAPGSGLVVSLDTA